MFGDKLLPEMISLSVEAQGSTITNLCSPRSAVCSFFCSLSIVISSHGSSITCIFAAWCIAAAERHKAEQSTLTCGSPPCCSTNHGCWWVHNYWEVRRKKQVHGIISSLEHKEYVKMIGLVCPMTPPVLADCSHFLLVRSWISFAKHVLLSKSAVG